MRKTSIRFSNRDRKLNPERVKVPVDVDAANETALHIIYGSRTGNSKAAAGLAYGYSRHLGLDSYLVDIERIDPGEFRNFRNIMLAVSTHGEGDPPAVAEKFYRFIHSSEASEMNNTRFSILALGDSSYRDFCQTGNDFSKRFKELGASEVYPLVECDIDYEENAKRWVREAVVIFESSLPRKGDKPDKPFAFEINKRESDHDNAWYARVIEKRLLTRPGYDKRTLHIALSMEDYTGEFHPGDSFGVYLSNSRLLVDELLKELKFDGTRAVKSSGAKKLLKEALLSDYELTLLTPVVISRYADLAGNHELSFLMKNRQFLDEYSKTNDVLDLIRDFPSDISPEEFLSVLRNLAPRIYSVASSPLAIPEQLHFTAGLIEYIANGREHRGVCSVYFADRVEEGDSIPIVHEPNEKFRLPPDDLTPIIMVGTGTGIAPFRAFLQQREYSGSKGESWLFFGDRHSESDFLYKDEILGYRDSGLLTRLNTSFSRDGAGKEYVQHQLYSNSEEIYDWIKNRKAVVYVCGNKRTMGRDVKLCFERIIASRGGFSAEEAGAFLQKLKSENRYLTDLY